MFDIYRDAGWLARGGPSVYYLPYKDMQINPHSILITNNCYILVTNFLEKGKYLVTNNLHMMWYVYAWF